VSRRHAVFHGGPPLEIEDLGSANGTFVSPASEKQADADDAQTADQRRVAVKGTRMQLGLGDTVMFGASLVVVRSFREETTTSANVDTDGAVVRDPALVRLYDEAARAAQLSLPVLIVGETGVGKEVLARFIHERSPRAKRPS